MILKKRSGWLYTAMSVILIAALGVPAFAGSDRDKATRNIFAMDTYMTLLSQQFRRGKELEDSIMKQMGGLKL